MPSPALPEMRLGSPAPAMTVPCTPLSEHAVQTVTQAVLAGGIGADEVAQNRRCRPGR